MATKTPTKIYTTTQTRPPGDILSLIGAPRHFGIGQFVTYVRAASKADAAEAIYHAYRGGSASVGDLRIASGDYLGPLVTAELLDTAGDVVTTVESGRYGVVLVRGAAEADGDPVRVGEWQTRQDGDDITYTVFVGTDGRVHAIPVDEVFRRILLQDRAEKAAAVKVEADAVVAIERVTAFLDRWSQRRDVDPDAVYGLDGGDDAGGVTLTVTDLRALLAAAAKVVE